MSAWKAQNQQRISNTFTCTLNKLARRTICPDTIQLQYCTSSNNETASDKYQSLFASHKIMQYNIIKYFIGKKDTKCFLPKPRKEYITNPLFFARSNSCTDIKIEFFSFKRNMTLNTTQAATERSSFTCMPWEVSSLQRNSWTVCLLSASWILPTGRCIWAGIPLGCAQPSE